MVDFDYDLFVIGAGSGGVRAARLSAGLGARVGIAEEYRIGGTCVIRGCIPKKLFVYAGCFADEFEDAKGFGWTVGEPTFDWPTLLANTHREVARLSGLYEEALNKAGVDIFRCRATLGHRHTVKLEGRDEPVRAKTILIATGARPAVPDVPGAEHFITSDQCFELKHLPRSIAIVGAGYIGMEFASIFAALGVEVTVIYRGPQVLRGFDDDLQNGVAEAMRARGISIRCDADLERVEKTGAGYAVRLAGGGSVEAELAMAATGRVPNTTGLGLQAAGLELGWRGDVVVDEFSRSAVENIYAVGDVTHRVQLTPVAIAEAHAFAETVFNDNPTPVDHSFIPTAVFCEPEIGTIGLSEEDARERCRQVDIYKSSFRPLKYTLAGREQRMLVKLVVDGESGLVLGCHILGPDAAEIVQSVAVAIRMGVTKADFDATMALHPSAAEELVTLRNKWEPPPRLAAE
jgi:glutathione reductase (NADPH)